jgi:hypothetical protein
MRLSDAGLRQRQSKALYPSHRLPPWLNVDETRDRSNCLNGLLLGMAVRHRCAKLSMCVFQRKP